jgi:hypothetical protein
MSPAEGRDLLAAVLCTNMHVHLGLLFLCCFIEVACTQLTFGHRKACCHMSGGEHGWAFVNACIQAAAEDSGYDSAAKSCRQAT